MKAFKYFKIHRINMNKSLTTDVRTKAELRMLLAASSLEIQDCLDLAEADFGIFSVVKEESNAPFPQIATAALRWRSLLTCSRRLLFLFFWFSDNDLNVFVFSQPCSKGKNGRKKDTPSAKVGIRGTIEWKIDTRVLKIGMKKYVRNQELRLHIHNYTQ